MDNWPGGVQPARRRGATCAVTGCIGCTEPSKEPCPEPSAAPARGRQALPAAGGPAGGGGRAGEFFAALGAAWLLTAAQRSRLTPAVLAALNAGWTPHELARFAGANAGGVQNPYAVLAARLSAAELPPPPGQRPPRPPWCGECDERTRMAGSYSDAPNPCRAASRRPARSSAAPAQTARTACMAVLRNRRALAPGRPSAKPTRCTATMRRVPPSTRTRSVHAGNDHPGR